MTRVLLTNLWSDDNKGDLAITAGLVRALRAHDPEVVVSGVSCFGASRHGLAHRFIRQAVDPILVPVWRPHDGESHGGARRWLDFLMTVAVFLSPSLSCRLFARVRPIVDAIAEADIVVAKGGQYLHDRSPSMRDQIGFLRQAHVLLLSCRMGTPVVLAGHSLRAPQGLVTRRVMAALLRRASLVWLREPESLSVADDLASGAALRMGADSAFAYALAEGHLPRPTERVVVVPRWLPNSPPGDERHLHQIAEVLGEIDRPVTVVAHGLGPSPLENDRTCARRLVELLAAAGTEVSFVEDDLDVGELLTLYGSAALVITVRLHAAILAMAGGGSAIALSYDGPKTVGLYRKASMEDCVLDATTLKSGDLRRITTAVMSDGARYRAAANEFAISEAHWLEQLAPQLLNLQR